LHGLVKSPHYSTKSKQEVIDMKPSDGEIYAGISKLCQNETIDAQAAKIAQLEKAVELACHAVCGRTDCVHCPVYPACVKGGSGHLEAHYMQKAKEATNG
jgi:hypothetical protein